MPPLLSSFSSHLSLTFSCFLIVSPSYRLTASLNVRSLGLHFKRLKLSKQIAQRGMANLADPPVQVIKQTVAKVGKMIAFHPILMGDSDALLALYLASFCSFSLFETYSESFRCLIRRMEIRWRSPSAPASPIPLTLGTARFLFAAMR